MAVAGRLKWCVLLFMICISDIGAVYPSRSLHATKEKSYMEKRSVIIDTDPEESAGLQSSIRKKRDVPVDSDMVKVMHLKDSHQQLMVHWVGEGSNVIMCLARDGLLRTASHASAVYISYDYGESFQNRTDQFKVNSSGDVYANIDKFFNHPKVISHSVFIDSGHNVIFTSSDYGKTFTRVNLNFSPSDVSFHESYVHTFLVHDKSASGNRKLWLTEDFGQSWSPIQESVKAFFWSSSSQEDFSTLLYVEREEPDGLSTVLSSGYLFRDGNFSVVITHVKDFQVMKDFMFATKQAEGNNVDLYLSHKRKPFVQGEFNTNLDCREYYIADVSDDQVMVVVAHNYSYTNLYISERLDDSVVKFSLSLERILCYFPNSTWTDSWLNDLADDSFADLHKVEGLRGIYIASQLVPNVSPKIIGPEHLSTVITFDHGGEWNPVNPPKYDDNGREIVCNVSSGCSLHLSQKFNQLYPMTRAVPILSSKSAPGIIMATGTIGVSLKGRPGVFVSTDAGFTWKYVLKDYYFFNFGDHGGVMVAVRYFKSHGETREILYSTDEGETWKVANFSTKELRMYGLMTEPGENTTIFTMFGSAPGAHQWLIIKVDLKSVFAYGCTKEADYKFWSPSRNGAHVACVMGRRETYERRVAHANCYNGMDYDRPVRMEICECFAEDFDCDFGFFRHTGGRECIRNKTTKVNPYDVPHTCRAGQFYNRTKGYIKIPDDPCEGGDEYLYLPDVLPCPVKEKKEFLLVAQRERIAQIDLTTMQLETLPITGLRNVIAIEFDLRNNCVYWADIVPDNIGRLCLDHGEREILVSHNLSSIEGMALDWVSNNLYFVDGMRAMIEVVRTDIHKEGRMRRVILGPSHLKKPRGIAVHPMRGYMYWTDWAPGDPSLNRADLNGTNIKRLFESPMVQWPNGVTIDHIAERIYWVDAREDYIASADLEGNNHRKIIVNDERVSHPFAVAVFKDSIYWDDWRKNSIFQADKDHGLGIAVLHEELTGLMDLKVFAHSVQEGTNACANQTTSGCKYLCMGMPNNGHSCLCPSEMKAIGGDCMCPDNTPPSANGTCKQIANTCSTEQFTCKNLACVPKLWKCDGDNDCGDNSDEEECSNVTCSANQFRCISDGKCIPAYWRCNYDADCNDGSDEMHCKYQECKVNQFKCANGRCISQRWRCDMEDDCKDGSDEMNCPLNYTSTCRSGEFKCDNSTQCIPNTWRCDSENDCLDGSDENKCVNATCESWQYKCKNGRCIFASWRCDGDKDCQDGSDEGDLGNCSTPSPTAPTARPLPVSRCSGGWMFSCTNKRCIPYWWKCDGVDDCGDNSDEYGCDLDIFTPPSVTYSTTPLPSTGCDRHQFQCDSGECILDAWLCDGMNDCANGEDEKNCKGFVPCREDEFKCRLDGSCIPMKKLCDKFHDCPDGTDEPDSCSDYGPLDPGIHTCSAGFFLCDLSSCLPASKLCDGHQDCYDGFDESKCNNYSKVLQVPEIAVDTETVTNSSLVLHWIRLFDQSLLYKPSYKEMDTPHTSYWVNASTWTSDSNYTITGLRAYTTYNMTVYVKRNGTDVVFPPAFFTNVTTKEGVPSPPWSVKLKQLSGRRVQVSWEAPAQPQGIIVNYILYYTPPIPPVSKFLMGSKTQAVVESSFEGNQQYSFWVVAENSIHKSNTSSVASLLFDHHSIIDTIEGLVVSAVTNSSITLSWKPVTKADGYYITPKCISPFPSLPRRKATSVNFMVDKLAPGTSYNFEVQAYNRNYVGPVSTITAKTEGSPLPGVERLTYVGRTDGDSKITLTWQAPSKPKANWVYGIYYATKLKDLFEGPKATTKNLNYTVSDLLPCESYLLNVGVVGPLGVGPLPNNPISYFTRFNMRAAPKNVKVSTDPRNETYMVVTWNSSCPTMTKPAGYMITVNETNLNQSSSTVLLPTAKTWLNHTFQVHYGGQYLVLVQTTEPDSIVSQEVYYSAPPILGPHQVMVFTEKNGSFVVSWKDGLLPPLMQNTEHKYKILVSPGPRLNVTGAMQYNATGSPFVISNLTENTIYSFAVVLETSDGYRSLMSEEVNYSESQVSWSTALFSATGLASVVVPIILVLIALMAALAFFVMRHRRLQRSFASFANSHYDTRSGSATFSGGDGLDEEDSPVIRGFSDDEPLVIA